MYRLFDYTQYDSHLMLLQFALKTFRVSSWFLRYIHLRAKWLFSSANNQERITVHLLVVKNPVYALLARTCVESFLHYHPNAQVIIHYDDVTFISLLNNLRAVMRLRKNHISFLAVQPSLSWQEDKLKLIISINGSFDFFLDADLRFNGPLTLHEKPVFLVKEEYFQILGPIGALSITSRIKCKNKNTSVFSWGGHKLQTADLQLLYYLYENLDSHLLDSERKREYVARLREQITLSAFFDIQNIEVLFIKTGDGQFDGSFIESSYYGATSSYFGVVGRRSIWRR